MVVYKYNLLPQITLDLPKGAEPLTVAFQQDQLFMWAKVDPLAERTKREFRVYGTGHDMPDGFDHAYIGTAHTDDGLVFHAFERLAQ